MSSPVGAANGDVFRYSYTCYFNSNDPHAVPPPDLSWINQTNYFMINVTGVSGSSVNFNTMLVSLNGLKLHRCLQHERWDWYAFTLWVCRSS